jgi:hypothetical protein
MPNFMNRLTSSIIKSAGELGNEVAKLHQKQPAPHLFDVVKKAPLRKLNASTSMLKPKQNDVRLTKIYSTFNQSKIQNQSDAKIVDRGGFPSWAALRSANNAVEKGISVEVAIKENGLTHPDDIAAVNHTAANVANSNGLRDWIGRSAAINAVKNGASADQAIKAHNLIHSQDIASVRAAAIRFAPI